MTSKLTKEGAPKKSAKEVAEAEPRPAVIEVIARPLQHGHSITIATKVAQDDGSVIDEVLTTSSTEKPLRLELRHLQELMLRAKVVGVVQYNSDQAAVLNVPLPDSPNSKLGKKKKQHAMEYPVVVKIRTKQESTRSVTRLGTLPRILHPNAKPLYPIQWTGIGD